MFHPALRVLAALFPFVAQSLKVFGDICRCDFRQYVTPVFQCVGKIFCVGREGPGQADFALCLS